MNKKYKFKSSTDVNNYNNFLLSLDKNKSNTNTNTQNNINGKDTNIILANYLEKLKNSYNNANGFNIVSNSINLDEIDDPNKYNESYNISSLSNEEKKICNILNSFKNIKSKTTLNQSDTI